MRDLNPPEADPLARRVERLTPDQLRALGDREPQSLALVHPPVRQDPGVDRRRIDTGPIRLARR